MVSLRMQFPWWLVLSSKIILSRLPVSYKTWKRLGLFQHGDMNEPDRAYENFIEHSRTAGLLDETVPVRIARNGDAFNLLELGPGDSLFSGVIAGYLGATRSWLVDSGSFATSDARAYSRLLHFLQMRGHTVGSPKVESVDLLLERGNIRYLTAGLESLRDIPEASIDFCFSNAVLEHIPRDEFFQTLLRVRKLMTDRGVCVHRVDLRDHLGGALNNLRFSADTWEGNLFRQAGFYTNRIRYKEMLDLFWKAGFDHKITRVTRWHALPTARNKMAEPFRALTDDDLLVRSFDVLLRPTPSR